MRGYKIGIVRDYTYGSKFDSAVENDLLNIEKADNYQQNIDKILDNRLDILIENRLVVLNALKISENEGEIKELNPTLSETPVYAWFTKKKNLETMINEFDKKILEIKQDGTFEKIYESYTNEESKR
ncbi:Bacterial extracellular solute-binding protein, family 3 [compost metagenome]